LQVQFLGCGDAFGSGGRFNTCFMVSGEECRFLIDCGASSMIAMRRYQVDPNSIGTVFLTHLHGDHFGGLPFMILDAQLMSKRSEPLTIVGPESTEKRLHEAMEVLFPGSSGIAWRFELNIEEFRGEKPWRRDPFTVSPYRVKHDCGAPPYALRIECEGRTITYTGDTEWVEALVPAAHEADLFIAEAYFSDKKVKFHLDLETLVGRLGEIRPKRLVLTHMSPEMLEQLSGIRHETAEDGLTLEI